MLNFTRKMVKNIHLLTTLPPDTSVYNSVVLLDPVFVTHAPVSLVAGVLFW